MSAETSSKDISVIVDGWVLTYAWPAYERLVSCKRCATPNPHYRAK